MIYEKLREYKLDRPGLHIFAGEYGSAKKLLLHACAVNFLKDGIDPVFAAVNFEGCIKCAISRANVVVIKDFGFLGQDLVSRLIAHFPKVKVFIIEGQGISESTDFSLVQHLAITHNVSVIVSSYVWNIDKESLEVAATRQLQHHIKAVDTLVLCTHKWISENSQVHSFWLASSTDPEVNEFRREIFSYDAEKLKEDLNK